VYLLKVKGHFDAAHHLVNHHGECSRIHGHRWVFELEVGVEKLQPDDMVMDFADIRQVLRNIAPDHCDLNEVYPHIQPTAENLARVLFDQAKARIPETVAVTVYETPDCGCRYDGGDDSVFEQAKAALSEVVGHGQAD
jgi:6-pyruvoyltetrahydropterin/6-carboxytetrahydropterin synthase